MYKTAFASRRAYPLFSTGTANVLKENRLVLLLLLIALTPPLSAGGLDSAVGAREALG